MDLKHFLKDAARRGEKIKEKFVEELLHSRFVNQLLKNKMFVEGIVSILNAKSGLERSLHHHVNSVLKILDIPNQGLLQTLERKIHRLESELEVLQRKSATRSLKKKTRPKTHNLSKKAKK